MLFGDSNLKKGTLRVNKRGFGFVEVLGEEEDIFISEENMKDAVDSDFVAVEITEHKSDGRREGRILRIIKRGVSSVIGEFRVKKGNCYVIPDDEN